MRGIDTLRDPLTNRGTAFADAQRHALGVQGWLPPRVESIEEQVARVLEQVRARSCAMEKYVWLASLQSENETLFFRTLMDNPEELLPIIYTPTVGQACLEWSRNYLRPRGLYISAHDRGRIARILGTWPQPRVDVIVVTDGSRILGLGDLGANGMGIPIGKLTLYVACAGVRPERCLPITLDVGTDTRSIRDDPLYLGLREPRMTGDPFDALIEEFVAAVTEHFPGALLQFEDFSNANAFRLLARFRDRLPSFNDDIQGTGAMGLGGLYAAQRLLGKPLSEQRLLFFGAGEAGIGIGSMVAAAMMREGLSETQARAQCWFVDSRGLVSRDRADLGAHKRSFACAPIEGAGLPAIVERVRPTVLVGASSRAGAFTPQVLSAMARINERPIIFALSNPTSKAECTAEAVFQATRGRAIFAAGSPFSPVRVDDRTCFTAQANNCFIFPGVGLGALACGARRITDEMFFAAARALADQVDDESLTLGRIFPPTSHLREVASAVALAVAKAAYAQGVATLPAPPDIAAYIEALRYHAAYPTGAIPG